MKKLNVLTSIPTCSQCNGVNEQTGQCSVQHKDSVCSEKRPPVIYLTNAFSPSMLTGNTVKRFILLDDANHAKRIIDSLVKGPWKLVSAIGHTDTASLMSSLLKIDVPFNRIAIKLGTHDIVLCGQLDTHGQRLPEGCTSLPEGAELNWWVIAPADMNEL